MKVLPILIFALISITGCKKYDFGETPDWHYLIVDDTYAPSWEGKTWVHYTCDYETQNDLYVEPIKYCDWVSDFDVRYEKMYVSLDSNKTGNDRSCLFVAYSEKTGQKDTFKIEQAKCMCQVGLLVVEALLLFLVVNAPHEQKREEDVREEPPRVAFIVGNTEGESIYYISRKLSYHCFPCKREQT